MAIDEPIDFRERPLPIDDDPETAVMQIVDEAAALAASDIFFVTDPDSVHVLVRHIDRKSVV